MKVKIRLTDHTGDSVYHEYETEDAKSVEVAQDRLSDFLNDCVSRFGTEPPVWARRVGEKDFDQLPRDRFSDLALVDEVIVQPPFVGG